MVTTSEKREFKKTEDEKKQTPDSPKQKRNEK
jgi:hypothetical protein